MVTLVRTPVFCHVSRFPEHPGWVVLSLTHFTAAGSGTLFDAFSSCNVIVPEMHHALLLMPGQMAPAMKTASFSTVSACIVPFRLQYDTSPHVRLYMSHCHGSL